MTARRGDALSHVLISALTRVFRQPSATGRVAYPGDRLGQRPPLQRIRSICKLHGAMPGRSGTVSQHLFHCPITYANLIVTLFYSIGKYSIG